MTFWTVKNQDRVQGFGKHLKKLRASKGFSQQVLADEADVAKSTVQRIENAQINVTIDVLFSMADALEIEPKELLDFKM